MEKAAEKGESPDKIMVYFQPFLRFCVLSFLASLHFPDCLDAPSKRRSRRSSFKASSSSNSTNKSLQLREFSESNLEGNHEEEERRNLWYFSEYGRLDCVRLDDKGGCRKWSLTPEDFSVHLAARNLKL
ncbi:hypothetical protein SK128_008114, partial [Halocaridina rubra]